MINVNFQAQIVQAAGAGNVLRACMDIHRPNVVSFSPETSPDWM